MNWSPEDYVLALRTAGYLGSVRLDGLEPWHWIKGAGLLDPFIGRVRVYNYGGMSTEEVYMLLDNGKLQQATTEKEFDPVELLSSEKATSGWEIHNYNPMRLRELAEEMGIEQPDG